MRKIILTALGCACLALLLGWLVTAQANASSSNDSASLLIVLVSIPLLLASVVFSVGASWVLRSDSAASSARHHNARVALCVRSQPIAVTGLPHRLRLSGELVISLVIAPVTALVTALSQPD